MGSGDCGLPLRDARVTRRALHCTGLGEQIRCKSRGSDVVGPRGRMTVMFCTGCLFEHRLCLLLLFSFSLASKQAFKQGRHWASNCATEVCGGRSVGVWDCLEPRGGGWIPLVVRARVHVGEQHILGLRWWLGESSSVLEDVEIVRKEKTGEWREDLFQFPLLSRRNFIKWKRWSKVGQIVSEEGLELLLCLGFCDWS